MKFNSFFTILTITFFILCAALYALSIQFRGNINLLLAGNLFLAVLVFFSYFMTMKTANDPNPNKFVGSIMKHTGLKFLILIIASLLLIYTQRDTIQKGDVFILMAVYVVYTVLETLWLMKGAQKK